MITADKTMIIETTNVIISTWLGNSGIVGDGEAVGVGAGVGVGVGVGVGAGVGVGVGVAVGFVVTETALEAEEVTGLEALSVTLQVTECEPAAAV